MYKTSYLVCSQSITDENTCYARAKEAEVQDHANARIVFLSVKGARHAENSY